MYQIFVYFPIICLIITCFLILYDKKFIELLFLMIFFGFILNDLLKRFFSLFNFNFIKRPTKNKCGIPILNIFYTNKFSDVGMPSGHAQIISIFCFYLMFYFKNIYFSIFLLTILIINLYMRVYIGCHTILQVIIGALIGYIVVIKMIDLSFLL